MSTVRLLQRNIICLFIIKFSQWLLLVMPISFLFYKSNGLALHQILTLQSAYSLAIVLLEIPTGYLADRWGRKKTIIIGALLGFAGYFIYSLSHNFWAFMCAELILGTGQSFVSGTDSAMLYDTLLSLKRKKKYSAMEGRLSAIGNFSEAAAGILGGLLAVISLQLPYLIQACVYFISVPAAMLLINPPLHSALKAGNRGLMNAVKLSLKENLPLRKNLLVSSFMGASTLTMAWFVQPYFNREHVATEMYGVLWAILNLSVGLTSMYSYRFDERFSQEKSSLLIVLGLAAGFLITGITPGLWVLAPIAFFYLVRGLATPVLKTYVQDYTPSDIRATVLSVRNFVIRIIFSVVGPLLGYIADKTNLMWAMFSAMLLYCGPTLLILKFHPSGEEPSSVKVQN
jgi:MFS family permease